MKLTYWIARCKDDSPRYNIRARTKKEILAGHDLTNFSAPEKIVVEYADAFDLMDQCNGEGGSE